MQGVVYGRTHDLLLLETLARDAGLTLPIEHDLLARLGPYAVDFRHLGSAAPKVSLSDAQAAVSAAISRAEAALGPAG